ncbi:MAG: polyhydroxyalkanoic acid system family protein [Myxococcota bacterium]
MKHHIPHGLPHALARAATREALESYRARFASYAPEGDWIDEDHARVSFRALGQRVEGAVVVGPDDVELELEVPLLLRPFRERALEVIEHEVRVWIERARAGQLSA